MIQSMTGYATAQQVADGASYLVEIRSLNNRYLKLSIKLAERLQFVESELDKLVRGRIGRGSITLALRVRSDADGPAATVNLDVLQRYIEQFSKARLPDGVKATIDLGTLATLPGVFEAPPVDDEARRQLRELACGLTDGVLDGLIEMRRREGESLCAELLACCDTIRAKLGDVAARAPHVVDEYHQRLHTRVETLLRAGGIDLEAEGLMREVAIYAERCDITEEISRIRSHLDQFAELCRNGDRVGRTLEFLTQELLREANTIASKSSDAAIARAVVEIKGQIDRLREQVQNVE